MNKDLIIKNYFYHRACSIKNFIDWTERKRILRKALLLTIVLVCSSCNFKQRWTAPEPKPQPQSAPKAEFDALKLFAEVEKIKASLEEQSKKTRELLDKLKEMNAAKEQAQEEEKPEEEKGERPETDVTAVRKVLYLQAETLVFVKDKTGIQIKPIFEVTLKDRVFSCELGLLLQSFFTMRTIYTSYGLTRGK